jgi:hypothetical protein
VNEHARQCNKAHTNASYCTAHPTKQAHASSTIGHPYEMVGIFATTHPYSTFIDVHQRPSLPTSAP